MHILDFFRNPEICLSSRRTTGEDRSLLEVNEDRSQVFNKEIKQIAQFREKSINLSTNNTM
jgi:hypothetical protein